MSDKNYLEKAENDAWYMVENFFNEILEQACEGDVSDDYNNDYAGGDEYHHETHIDKAYDLLDAATLLDQLSDHEETDYGLWEGIRDPREVISCQAAYTYGNAVGYYWNKIIEEINDFLNMWEWDNAEERKTDVTKFLTVFVKLNVWLIHNEDTDGMIAGVLSKLDELDWTGTLVLCDWLDERDNSPHMVKELRGLLA